MATANESPTIIDLTAKDDDSVSSSSKSEYGVVGILNLGNTCYANSVIQVLRSIPAFASLVLKNALELSPTASPQLKEFWDAFGKLIKQLWKQHRGVTVRPKNYFTAIQNLVRGTAYEEFGTPIPNDAHEYYVFLLDKIQTATHRPQKPLHPSASDADRAWHKSFEKDYSKMVPLFYGQIKRTLQCHHCRNETHVYEIFNTIKVDLKENQAPLIDSIVSTFATEEIDGYRCDKCADARKATITQKIIRTPPYLSITINRFSEGFGIGRKDTKTFTLDNDDSLDLSSVITDDTNKQYSLMSMIDHHGSMRGGHYICHIKHVPQSSESATTEGPKPGQWYLYDDDSIYDSSKAHISQSTYMLFFRRTSSN